MLSFFILHLMRQPSCNLVTWWFLVDNALSLKSTSWTLFGPNLALVSQSERFLWNTDLICFTIYKNDNFCVTFSITCENFTWICKARLKQWSSLWRDFMLFRGSSLFSADLCPCKMLHFPTDCKSSFPITEVMPRFVDAVKIKEKVPHSMSLGLFILTLFGSTYTCRSSFSRINATKTTNCASLTSQQLHHCLCIAVTTDLSNCWLSRLFKAAVSLVIREKDNWNVTQVFYYGGDVAMDVVWLTWTVYSNVLWCNICLDT